MRSIRQRLFIQIGALIVLLLGLMLIANTLFLEDFYVKNQQTYLIEMYQRINELDDGDYQSSDNTFIDIESSANIDIVIMSESGDIAYVTNERLLGGGIKPISPQDSALPNDRKPSDSQPPQLDTNRQVPIHLEDETVEHITTNVQIRKGDDPLTGDTSMVLTAQLDDGYSLNLRMPMASIRTSISSINRFLLIIGVFVLIIALIVTYALSNSFTKPIRQINQTALRLKSLDFTKPIAVSTKDEIGELSHSINAMSQSLEATINSLNISNEHLTEEIDAKNRLDEKRRQLLSNVSHELKTPLALMQGYADALMLNISKDPKRVDFYCEVIVDETLKMNQLVQHLLDIDQVEFGDTTSHPTKLNLSELVAQMARKYQHQYDEKQIDFTSNIADGLTIFADPLRIDQVITNYITNALHYCDDNKKASITLKRIETTDGPKALLECFNTAPSIPSDQVEKLWDSFYKIDKARTRAVGGHGLGLSIVKAIQESDGNGYGCSNKDNGVVFWFDVPLTD